MPPNEWLKLETADEYNAMLPLGTKEAKKVNSMNAPAVFMTFTVGVLTARDEVAYDFNKETLVTRIEKFVDDYNAEVDRYRRAVKYLFLMKTMGGRGLTLSTDMNGFLGMIDPRYGGPWLTNTGFGGTPGKDVCGGSQRGILDGPPSAPRKFSWNTIEVYSQRYEHNGVWYDDYTCRATDSVVATKAAWTDPAMGPHIPWRQLVARAHDQMREDGAPRFPIDDVYFNDHGPELPIHHWWDQDGNRIGQQLWPIQRWNRGHSGCDFNLDGLQHIGLLPDLIQDMRNVGVQWEQLGPLFRGAQDFVDLWRRSVAIGAAHP